MTKQQKRPTGSDGPANADRHVRKMRVLGQLIDEVSRVHFRLGALAERIHHEGQSSSGRRAILRNVVELGPLSVPELARMRPVSRQFIQTLVNQMVADGWVTLEPNPAHRRSRLVTPTPFGRRALSEMVAKEAPAVEWLLDEFDLAKLEQVASFLDAFRGRIDSFEVVND